MKKRNEEFSVKELLNIFIPKLWLIVIVSLAFGFVMAFYSAFVKEAKYTSTTRIHIGKTTSGATSDINVNDVEFATFYLQTYVELIQVPDFLDDVLNDFKKSEVYAQYGKEKGWEGLRGSDIKKYISTSTVQDILTVSVTTGDKYLSHGLALSIEHMIIQDEKQLLAYPRSIVTPHPIQAPQLPKGEDSRRVPLNTIIGAAVGAILSMALVFVTHMLDVTIRDKKKIEDNFDIPVLGVIPRFISEEGKAKK